MIRFKRLVKNDTGAAAIEMAFVLPALVTLLWMVVQLGLVFRAMSGIQHALGEGARAATLFPYPDPDDSDAITDKMEAAVYGIGPGDFDIVTPVEGTEDGSNYLDLTVTYTQDTDLIFVPGPTISVTKSKRVWVAEAD